MRWDVVSQAVGALGNAGAMTTAVLTNRRRDGFMLENAGAMTTACGNRLVSLELTRATHAVIIQLHAVAEASQRRHRGVTEASWENQWNSID